MRQPTAGSLKDQDASFSPSWQPDRLGNADLLPAFSKPEKGGIP